MARSDIDEISDGEQVCNGDATDVNAMYLILVSLRGASRHAGTDVSCICSGS
jgi:hypothetical protein